jgi:hypothetical protein
VAAIAPGPLPSYVTGLAQASSGQVQASITGADPELLEELAFVKPYTKGVLMEEVLGSHADNWNERGAVVQFW